MWALLAIVLIAVAAPETHGILAAHVEAERAVSPGPSWNLAECNRQSTRLTPRLNARPLSCQHADGVLVGCSSCPSVAQALLARLPSRGGAKEGLQQQALGKGGEKKRSTTLTAVHKSVAGNLVAWAAIVVGALMCSRTKLKDEEGARY